MYPIITAAEAAAMIKHNENLALSGFTPAGVAKAVTKELAKIAVKEHEAGREFKVGIFTGASTGHTVLPTLPTQTSVSTLIWARYPTTTFT